MIYFLTCLMLVSVQIEPDDDSLQQLNIQHGDRIFADFSSPTSGAHTSNGPASHLPISSVSGSAAHQQIPQTAGPNKFTEATYAGRPPWPPSQPTPTPAFQPLAATTAVGAACPSIGESPAHLPPPFCSPHASLLPPFAELSGFPVSFLSLAGVESGSKLSNPSSRFSPVSTAETIGAGPHGRPP